MKTDEKLDWELAGNPAGAQWTTEQAAKRAPRDKGSLFPFFLLLFV